MQPQYSSIFCKKYDDAGITQGKYAVKAVKTGSIKIYPGS